MINTEITETIGKLRTATGHFAWKWNDHDAYRSEGLMPAVADGIVAEIRQLGGRISCNPVGDTVTLTISLDDARALVVSESRDRAHAPSQPTDERLDYLQSNHKGFIWQKAEGGYSGYGFNLLEQGKLTEPFLRVGIVPKTVDVSTGHYSTYGIFLPYNDVDRLITKHHAATRA